MSTTEAGARSASGRVAAVGYGVAVYAVFLVTFAYTVFFVAGLLVPRTLYDGPAASTAEAIAIDVVLLAIFAGQHSIMARPGFKRRWTRLVPAPVERTTYVLCATAALALLMWQWRPIPGVLWEIDGEAWRGLVHGVSFAGWGIVLVSTFLIDHWDLFGLRQVLRHWAGRGSAEPHFRTPLLYRVVRHPLYLGFLVAFWAAPTMTAGRLLFCIATTTYVLGAVRLEEHDLVDAFGDDYRDYRRHTPMLLPGFHFTHNAPTGASEGKMS